MKMLFNETFNDKITIWYDTDFKCLDDFEKGYEKIVDMITIEDLMLDTYFVFYTQMVSKDAIGDSVRTTVYVSCSKDSFDVSVNVSDFQFVCNSVELRKLINNLNSSLNSRVYNK